MKSAFVLVIVTVLLLATVLVGCNVNIQSGSQTEEKATAEAVKHVVETSVAATKVALESAAATTIAQNTQPPQKTTHPPTGTKQPPTAAPKPTTAPSTPSPKSTKSILPVITVAVPTLDAKPTSAIVPVVTLLPNVTPPIANITVVPTLPPPMRICDPPAATSFQKILNSNPNISAAIGCPTGINPHVIPEAWEVQTAFQPFEHGMMIWSNKFGWYDKPVIYVLYDTGAYQQVDDTFEDGDLESEGLTPPAGLYEPIRGFGKVWRDVPYVSASLGWATQPEVGGVGRFQIMENGEIIWLSETGHTYVFTDADMRWYEFDEPFQH